MEKIVDFDNKVEEYEKWFEENENIYETQVEAIRKVLPDLGVGIEIGVGTGLFSSRLGIRYGVEPSKEMSKKAVQRGINVINAYAEEIPVINECYEYVLMVTVDCFLRDIIKAFREVWRILSEGGYFIIAFLDKDTPLGIMYDQNKHLNDFYRYANFHSADEIEKYLEMTGFEVHEKKQTIYTLENKVQEIKEGVGEGVFAVIKAKKC